MRTSIILPSYPDKTNKERSKVWTSILKEHLDKKEFTKDDVKVLSFWRKWGTGSQSSVKPSYIMFGKIRYQTVEVDHFTYGEVSFYSGHISRF